MTTAKSNHAFVDLEALLAREEAATSAWLDAMVSGDQEAIAASSSKLEASAKTARAAGITPYGQKH